MQKRKYRLVLQFGAVSTEDLDRLVADLDNLATVDGHDFGSGESSIFILTDDPAESFSKARRAVTDQGVPNVMRSACREVDREDYVILWPSSLRESQPGFTVSSTALSYHPTIWRPRP